jgi:putative endonuclease
VGRHATTATVGRRAEQLAFAYLIERQLQPVARNFHCRGGEIDLIMLDQNCLTFIEVRYRATATFSSASHTVDQHKQRKIIRTAAMFIARNHRFSNFTMRFDVVAIEGHSGERVEWLQDAFRPINSNL